jgi:hypothetical protein
MPLIELLDWNNRTVMAVRSRGGVFAFPDFADNLIRMDSVCWPPADLVQKLFKSEKLWAFSEEDQTYLSAKLGYYCDLQSVHSEDALHWSYFGPLIYATDIQRLDFARWLRTKLSLKAHEPASCSLSCWRRVPHPENGTPNGPEMDLLIVTDTFTLALESKWRSGEGRWQGMAGNSTQLELRQRFLAQFGPAVFRNGLVAVLYVILDQSQSSFGNPGIPIPVLNMKWSELCQFAKHPRADEVKRYYDWKRNLVVRKFGTPAPG